MPFDNDGANSIDLGQRIKTLRLRRRLSQRGLAKKSGMAPATVSLIERNAISPSAGTLIRLAEALEEQITAFFEPEPTVVIGLHFVPAKNRRNVRFASGMAEDLGAGGQLNAPVVPCLLTLDPGAQSDQFVMPRGQTFIYCLEGTIRFEFNEQVFELEEGDSLLFAAHKRHQWSNVSDQQARMLVVMCNVINGGDALGDYFGNPLTDPNG